MTFFSLKEIMQINRFFSNHPSPFILWILLVWAAFISLVHWFIMAVETLKR